MLLRQKRPLQRIGAVLLLMTPDFKSEVVDEDKKRKDVIILLQGDLAFRWA